MADEELYPSLNTTPHQYMATVKLSRFSLQLDLWIPPIIIFIGFIGNSFTIFIMSNRRFIRFSTCLYLLAIAILDLLILLVFLMLWMEINFSLFSKTGSDIIMCKVFGFIAMTLSYLSAWSTVSMTIDRFMAVYRPISRRINKPKVRTILLIIVIISAVLSLPYFSYQVYNVNETGHDLRCTLSNGSLLGRIFAWVEFFIEAVIPSFILISLNSAIIHRIRQNRDSSFVRENTNNTSISMNINNTTANNGDQSRENTLRRTASRAPKRPKSLNVLLIIASFSFLFFTLPYRIYRLHWFISDLVSVSPNLSHNSGLETVMYRIVKYLWYLGHSTNFYLYVLGGGGRFRYQLWRSLKCETMTHSVSET